MAGHATADAKGFDVKDFASKLVQSAITDVSAFFAVPSYLTRPAASAESKMASRRLFGDVMTLAGGKTIDSVTFQTASGGTMRILQPLVHKQHSEGACGYHALHNALTVLDVVSAPDSKQSAALLHMFGAAGFHASFQHAQKMLLKQVADKNTNKYPWTQKDVQCGVLERLHLDFLLEADHKILGPAFNVSSLSEFSVESLDALHAVFEQMRPRADGSSYSHAFMLGAVNHWNSLVVNRVGEQVEIVVADSRNDNVVSIDLDEVKARSLIMLPYTPAFSRFETDYRRRLFVESRRKTMENIAMFRDCVAGFADIRSVFIDLQMQSLIRSYFLHVLWTGPAIENMPPLGTFAKSLRVEIPVPKSAADSAEAAAAWRAASTAAVDAVSDARVLAWLADWYPPAMFRSRDIARIRQVGLQHVSDHSLAALSLWVDELRAWLHRTTTSSAAGAAAAATVASSPAAADAAAGTPASTASTAAEVKAAPAASTAPAADDAAAKAAAAAAKAAAKAADLKTKLGVALGDWSTLIDDIRKERTKAKEEAASTSKS